MCWAKSFIPKLVWQIGDSTSNIIESLHSDVNSEGITCSLVGGLCKGHHFDNLKLKTLSVRCYLFLCWQFTDFSHKVFEMTGIRPSHQRGHISESTLRGLKRKCKFSCSQLRYCWTDADHSLAVVRQKVLRGQDLTIKTHNERLQKAKDALDRSKQRLFDCQIRAANYPRNKKYQSAISTADSARARAEAAYQKAIATSLEAVGSGSGRVGILLPVPSTSST
jgi:hypothetical protein